MGITPADLFKLASLKRQGVLGDIRSVFEIGSQNVYCEAHEDSIRDIFNAFDRPILDRQFVQQLANRGSGRELFLMLGLEYCCVDTNGEHGALTIDLNYDSVPASYRNKYDLVTNFGTTEHVANQFNCFNVIHDLTKAGGVMFHDLTFTGYETHGLFNYTPKFFWRLTASNFYEIIGMWIGGDGRQRYIHPDVVAGCKIDAPVSEQTFSHQDGCLRAVMRKRFDIPFVPPLDVPDIQGIPDAARGRYWTLTEPGAFERCLAGEHPMQNRTSGPSHATGRKKPALRRVAGAVRKLFRKSA